MFAHSHPFSCTAAAAHSVMLDTLPTLHLPRVQCTEAASCFFLFVTYTVCVCVCVCSVFLVFFT